MNTTKTRKGGKSNATKREQMLHKIQILQDRVEKWREEMDDEEIALITASFQGYSERNAQLIAMQCPTATTVRGYHEWIKLGRHVTAGEKGIAILAPAGSKVVTENNQAEGTAHEDSQPQNGAKVRKFFRLAYVFDIEQTHVMTDEEKSKIKVSDEEI